MCGIVGVIAADGGDVYPILAKATNHVRNRGNKGSGFLVVDPTIGNFHYHRSTAPAPHLFEKHADNSRGDIGVSFTRYRTSGALGKNNSQPLWYPKGSFGLDVNGDGSNRVQIFEEIRQNGGRRALDTDIEEMIRVMGSWVDHYRESMSREESLVKGIREVQRRIMGGYAAIVPTMDELWAFTDPHGYRPLVMGKKDGKHPMIMFASETYPMEKLGFSIEHHLGPGEILQVDRKLNVIDHNQSMSGPFVMEYTPCTFEKPYFSRGESRDRNGVQNSRGRADVGTFMAQKVYKERPELIDSLDCVMPIPRSPIPAAEAFAEEIRRIYREKGDPCNLLYATYITKDAFAERLFQGETQEEREEAAAIAFNFDERIKGMKRVMLIDDSLVRGTNSRAIIKKLKDMGVEEVYLALIYPQIKSQCHRGVAMKRTEYLLAHRFAGDTEKMANAIDADGLFFPTVDEYRKDLRIGGCYECSTGRLGAPLEYSRNIFPVRALTS